MRRKTLRHSYVDRDVEMQVSAATPLPPRRPESVYVRAGPARVSRMGRFDFKSREQRVQFCDVPVTGGKEGRRGGAPAGFF
jgi:hypothetical protein